MKLSFPAKLIIAGEWNVLLPQRKGIVANVDRHLTAAIQKSSHYHLTALPLSPQSVQFHPQEKNLQQYDEWCQYPLFVITKVIEYLHHKHSIVLSPFSLTIDSSQFYLKPKTKLGLGSSAAVTVSIIKILFQWYKKEADSLEIFFLACACYREFQKIPASGIDIASTLWPGWMEYSAPEKFFTFHELLQIHDFSKVSKPYIHHFTVSPSLHFMAVYLKLSVSTANTLKRISIEQFSDAPQLLQIEQMVSSIRKILQSNTPDMLTLKKIFSEHIILLQEFSSLHELDLMGNPHFEPWLNLANDLPVALKHSGTGAYDCGIAITDNAETMEIMKQRWDENGFAHIAPLL